MRCEYCGRRTGDMPNHLRKYPACHEKHKDALVAGFRMSLCSKCPNCGAPVTPGRGYCVACKGA